MAHRDRMSRLEEKMKMLRNLINDAKLSRQKLFELQMEYCYLQREFDLKKGKG